jgi:UDP-N-acetylmuramoyl-tripeptide--D-alanyl-D-alanine ligase
MMMRTYPHRRLCAGRQPREHIETPSLSFSTTVQREPDSTASAILSASELPGRLVCILGDMLELGGDAAELHRQTGELAREKGALLLTVGALSRSMGGMHFADKQDLIAALSGILKKGDVVLVKASHSMAFEEISEALKTLELRT